MAYLTEVNFDISVEIYVKKKLRDNFYLYVYLFIFILLEDFVSISEHIVWNSGMISK